jgi:membrane associated rhomboid family serine protease
LIPLKDMLPTRRFPAVTVTLIVANAAVFLYQVLLGREGGQFLAAYAMTPYEITHGSDLVGAVSQHGFQHVAGPSFVQLTLLTSMFMHGGFLHIAGNMLYLWIFGNNVEDALGRGRFIVFYLLSGMAAHAAQIASAPDSVVPTVGASGAIAGVLAGYLVLFPRTRVLTLVFLGYFIRVLQVPAYVLLLFWILLQAFQGFVSLGVGSPAGGGVAWFEHIGGFAAGLILIKVLAPRSRAMAGLRYR